MSTMNTIRTRTTHYGAQRATPRAI